MEKTFLMARALSLVRCAPVANRPVTLEPVGFRVLILFVYVTAGGMSTLVHFTIVFPKPKRFLSP